MTSHLNRSFRITESGGLGVTTKTSICSDFLTQRSVRCRNSSQLGGYNNTRTRRRMFTSFYAARRPVLVLFDSGTQGRRLSSNLSFLLNTDSCVLVCALRKWASCNIWYPSNIGIRFVMECNCTYPRWGPRFSRFSSCSLPSTLLLQANVRCLYQNLLAPSNNSLDQAMPANRQNPPKDNDAIVVAARALQRTLCNNVATMNRAVAALRSCSYIVCDCEGTHLGASGGSLSLIVLCGIPTDNNRQPHVYLIDAITLKGRALEPVFALLRSDEHTKIMYDARMDWSELFHRHNVELHRVLDLELADVDSRSLRGEGPDAQLTRLFSFCKESNVESQRSSYLEIHRLNSLEACATEHGVIHSPKKVKARKLFFKKLILHTRLKAISRPFPTSIVVSASSPQEAHTVRCLRRVLDLLPLRQFRREGVHQ